VAHKIAQDIYLASPLFSEAERAFNASIAAGLRERSLTVFLPQELSANHTQAPTESQIFVGDTQALLSSRLMLAVLDGETTDAGVATEIGIALSHHIPVVGLWTDIRQRRLGSGRMYRNIYVTGAINHNGTIATSSSDAIERCVSLLSSEPRNHLQEAERIETMFKTRDDSLSALRGFFPTAYDPTFSHDEFIVNLIAKYAADNLNTVIDYGCGGATLSASLRRVFPNSRYIGVDRSAANSPNSSTQKELLPTDRRSADVLVLSFVLHDYHDKIGLTGHLREFIRPGGVVILLDLEKGDLPILTGHFERQLLRFGACHTDARLSAGSMRHLSERMGFSVVESGLKTLEITFPTSDILETYLTAFGIDEGFDLGLVRHHGPGLAQAIKGGLETLTFPFRDYRSFVYAVLR